MGRVTYVPWCQHASADEDKMPSLVILVHCDCPKVNELACQPVCSPPLAVSIHV